VGTNRLSATDLMADVATALGRRYAALSADVYDAILREIPELAQDRPVLALLASSVDSNVSSALQIMQHRIDLATVQAPAAAVEYARRLAQRGTPLTLLLRAYRVAHLRFSDWVFEELALQDGGGAEERSTTTLEMTRVMANYIDLTSEAMVAAYAQERENWLHNRSAARAARIRDLLSGDRIDVGAVEAALGYQVRQYHLGLVCWADSGAESPADISQIEHTISKFAEQAACPGSPVILPRDEAMAWAWVPMGTQDTLDPADTAAGADIGAGIHLAFGDPAFGATGFRTTHQQAIATYEVALASGSSSPRALSFAEVAPIALMLASSELMRAWVLSTLAGLAADDEDHARLRDTLLVFLEAGGSYKATAEQLMLHKNTVHYRIRKAQESLGRPVSVRRHDLELALRISRWLRSSVLRPPAAELNKQPRIRRIDRPV
jgi:hypothetical protein